MTPAPCLLCPQDPDADEIDAAEAFERMQLERIAATDPNSTAYHAALRKTAAAPPGEAPGMNSRCTAEGAVHSAQYSATASAGDPAVLLFSVLQLPGALRSEGHFPGRSRVGFR